MPIIARFRCASFLAIPILFGCMIPSRAQDHGTAVIALSTDKEVIIATDSLEVEVRNGKKEHVCKVENWGGAAVVFVGIVSFPEPTGTFYVKAFSHDESAFLAAHDTDSLYRAVVDWVRSIGPEIPKFPSDFNLDSFVDSATGNYLGTYFFKLTDSGHFTYTETAFGVRTDTVNRWERPDRVIAMGQAAAVIRELEDAKSDRAKTNLRVKQKFHRLMNSDGTRQERITFAKDVLKLAAEWHAETVGPPNIITILDSRGLRTLEDPGHICRLP